MDSTTSGKVYHTPLNILVSSPVEDPSYYTRNLNGPNCCDGYYNDEYSTPQSCPPPPTGPSPAFPTIKKLSIETDLNIDNCKHNDKTPTAPITNKQKVIIDYSDSFTATENCDPTVTIETTISPKYNTQTINRLRGFGDIGAQVDVGTDAKYISHVNFDGVEYIKKSPKTTGEEIIEPDDNCLENYRVDIVMRNMDVSKEEARNFINSDENEENLCPLIEMRDRVKSFDSVTSREYNCNNDIFPPDEKVKVIEEYEVKLNDLTLEIYEKQTRLEELELSLNLRAERLSIKETEFANTTLLESAFHISVIVLIGYATTKVFGLFA